MKELENVPLARVHWLGQAARIATILADSPKPEKAREKRPTAGGKKKRRLAECRAG